MPRKNAESAPLGTRKVRSKNIEHGKKSEKISRLGLPEHRDLESTYQRLEIKDKKELAQTALDKAFEQQRDEEGVLVEDLRLQDIPELPKFRGKLSDVEQKDHPQFFKKHVRGDEYLIVVRLNNGEPNSLLMFNADEKKEGEFSKKLQNNKIFHLGSEEEFDKSRRNPLTRTYWTGEGMWMKGERTAAKYRKNFEGHVGARLENYHKRRDKEVMKGFGAEKRKDQRRIGQENLGKFKEKFFYEMTNMWEQEDARREIREEKREKMQMAVDAIQESLAKELRNTKDWLVEVAEGLAEKGIEKGKEKAKQYLQKTEKIINVNTTENKNGKKSTNWKAVLHQMAFEAWTGT